MWSPCRFRPGGSQRVLRASPASAGSCRALGPVGGAPAGDDRRLRQSDGSHSAGRTEQVTNATCGLWCNGAAYQYLVGV